MFIPETPTITTRPFLRAAAMASSIGSFELVLAVRITASQPMPRVKPSMVSSELIELVANASAPNSRARANCPSLISSPITRQPAAFRSCTVSWPRRPRPTTATDSPSETFACRTPCIAIAPSVANAASSKLTPSGILTARFFGMAITSACEAYPAPAHATRSPGAKSSHADSITIPAAA